MEPRDDDEGFVGAVLEQEPARGVGDEEECYPDEDREYELEC